MVQEGSPDGTQFQADISELSARWVGDTPLVLLLGAFSSGKTSLLARLLELSWLPVAKTATTAVPTEFRFGPRLQGELRFRKTIQFTLVPETDHRGSGATQRELLRWLRDPDAFRVREVHEFTGRDRRLLQPRSIADGFGREAVGSVPNARSVRSFELSLHAREPEVLDLADPSEFARHLTDPGLALSVSKAVCEVPHPHLRHLTFLDSAGLCSPVGFHADPMEELRHRKPDGVVVLLDARRPVSPTNTVALEALRLFVRTPTDYQRVLFGFTWWDQALRRFMSGEDHSSGSPRDFNSPAEREAATAERLPTLCDQLKDTVAEAVGVPVPGNLAVVPLALGPAAPAEMRGGPTDLCRRLESGFAGRLGIRMWAERWNSAVTFGPFLLVAHKNASDEVARRLHLISDDADRAWEAKRISREREQLRTAVARAIQELTEIVKLHTRKMLTEIAGQRSKKDLLAYINSGYDRSAIAALAALADVATSQRQMISHFYPDISALRPIAIDAQLLGIDKATRTRVQDLLSGTEYSLKAMSDAVIGSIVELTKDDREAARDVLSGRLRTTSGILTDAAQIWSIRARMLEDQAMVESQRRSEALTADQQEVQRLRETLRQRLADLESLEPRIRELAHDIDVFTRTLAAQCDTESEDL
ncbi:dynamin family protein [Streptomyces phaeochromogenes]